jgi:hypothetical protein
MAGGRGGRRGSRGGRNIERAESARVKAGRPAGRVTYRAWA